MFSIRHGDGKRLLVPYHTFTSADFSPPDCSLVINAAGLLITLKCVRWNRPEAREGTATEPNAEVVNQPGAFLDYLEVMRVRTLIVGGDVTIEIKSALDQAMEEAAGDVDEGDGYDTEEAADE